MVCVADGVDGKVVDDTPGGQIGVCLRVNVRVTFPRLPGPKLYNHTELSRQVFEANHFSMHFHFYL